MKIERSRLRIGTWAGWLALALLAMAAAAGLPRWGADARAEVREQPAAPQAFLSGGARSEIVLREIADVLKRIDSRLERLERAIDAANQQPEPAPGGDKEPKNP